MGQGAAAGGLGKNPKSVKEARTDCLVPTIKGFFPELKDQRREQIMEGTTDIVWKGRGQGRLQIRQCPTTRRPWLRGGGRCGGIQGRFKAQRERVNDIRIVNLWTIVA